MSSDICSMVMGVPMVIILFARKSACSLVVTLCSHLKAVLVVAVIFTCFVSKFKYFCILLPFAGEAFLGDLGAVLRASWLRIKYYVVEGLFVFTGV